MKISKQIVIVFQKKTMCNEAFESLKQMGFEGFELAQSLSHVHQLLGEETSIVMYAASSMPLALAVAEVRAILEVGGLIVVPEVVHSALVSEMLIAGADACVSIEGDNYIELLAWQTVLKRRADRFTRIYEQKQFSSELLDKAVLASKKEAENTHPHTWRLADEGWSLISSSGASIDLTHSEKFFLECFVGQVDKRISREELLAQTAIKTHNSRAIDSLVSRLRRKANDEGLSLPIKSIHGWGYSFVGLLLSQHQESVVTVFEEDPPDAFYDEVVSQASLMQQLEQGRFDFTYQPIVSLQNEQSCGAKAQVVWFDSQGRSFEVAEYYDYLKSLGLVELVFQWVLKKLTAELIEWQANYDLHLPVYFALPASVFMSMYAQIDSGRSQMEIARNLYFVVYDIDPTCDMVRLNKILQSLKERGVKVWLRYEDNATLFALRKSFDFSGLSVDDVSTAAQSVVGEQTEFQLILAEIKQQQLPLMCESVNSKEQRSQALELGAQYIVGNAVSLALQRDGLLLAWASRH